MPGRGNTADMLITPRNNFGDRRTPASSGICAGCSVLPLGVDFGRISSFDASALELPSFHSQAPLAQFRIRPPVPFASVAIPASLRQSCQNIPCHLPPSIFLNAKMLPCYYTKFPTNRRRERSQHELFFGLYWISFLLEESEEERLLLMALRSLSRLSIPRYFLDISLFFLWSFPRRSSFRFSATFAPPKWKVASLRSP